MKKVAVCLDQFASQKMQLQGFCAKEKVYIIALYSIWLYNSFIPFNFLTVLSKCLRGAQTIRVENTVQKLERKEENT